MKTDSAIARSKRVLHSAAMRLTGGRPMTRVQSLFVDQVSGELVSEYRDQLGRHWMATGPWGVFRVRKRGHTFEEIERAEELARQRLDIYRDYVPPPDTHTESGSDAKEGA